MYKGIVFDMDGVLIDSEMFYFQRRMKFFEEQNIAPGSKDINDYVGKSNVAIWDTLVPNNEQEKKRLKAIYENTFLPKNEIDYLKYSRKNLENLFQLLKDNNIKTGIASASARKNIETMIIDLNIKKYLDFYISGEECSKNKPDPEIYILSINKINLGKKEILVVEDSFNGIKAANKASLDVVAIKPKGYKIFQDDAKYIVDDIFDILKIVFPN